LCDVWCSVWIHKQSDSLCTSIDNMATRITQETFDAAVLENIELLEMSPEDAVLEAVQQFEAQVLTLF